MYELATEYYKYHSNLEIPQKFKTINGYEYDETGLNLGIWLNNQRRAYKKGGLSEEKIQKLSLIEMRFEAKKRETLWNNMYKLAKTYYNHYGNLEIQDNFKTINGYEYHKDGLLLGLWITRQRRSYRIGILTEERIKKLNEIGMRLKENQSDVIWAEMYNLAKEYYNYHGNLEVPRTFKTTDGYTYDKDGLNLGNWIDAQRTKYKTNKLPKERIEKLTLIKMRFERKKREEEWDKTYNLAKKYYDYHRHLQIPYEFKTLNGYEYDEKGINLGVWLNNQKTYYKKGQLSESRTQKLRLIGMNFELKNKEAEWDKMYNLAKAYYQYHGNLQILTNFKTKNGYDYDEEGAPLGRWLNNQKQYYYQGTLSKDKIEKLKLINLNFGMEKIFLDWEEMYNLAKSYYEHYGNLQIPKEFKTKNGYVYDKDGLNLGEWRRTQRRNYQKNKLTIDKIEKLKLLNMNFDRETREIRWDKMYNLAQAYYEHYGNLQILTNFKTKNGYDYDEEGLNLGAWLNNQKQNYRKGKLEEERIQKLSSIGIVFRTRNQNITVNKVILCTLHGIDYQKYQNTINKISYQELYSKIFFLEEYNIPIIINEELNEIFYMR